MSTSATKISEADVDFRNEQKTKKRVKWMLTSAVEISKADVDIHFANLTEK